VSRIGLVVHHAKPEAVARADSIIGWLEARGHETVRLRSNGDDGAIDPSDEAGTADLLISLGGDGTMLRTVDVAAPHGIPVLGVNIGDLGYLTAVEPEGLELALEAFFAGDHTIERRLLLDSTVVWAGPDAPEPARGPLALNEAVVEKVLSGRTARIAVSLSGRHFTTYAADGVIVATPTGSTAYALSARGPIVAPTHRALLLTPVAPHMLFDRTLVLEPDEVVRLEVVGPRPAALATDGRQIVELTEGDAVECRAAERSAELVQVVDRDFHRILIQKFGLPDVTERRRG
jgi:NAD+ kinase